TAPSPAPIEKDILESENKKIKLDETKTGDETVKVMFFAKYDKPDSNGNMNGVLVMIPKVIADILTKPYPVVDVEGNPVMNSDTQVYKPIARYANSDAACMTLDE